MNGNGVKSYSRPNQRELLQKIKPFLTNVEGEACLWPLVDMVTIYFDHNLLEQGVEILDLPGTVCQSSMCDYLVNQIRIGRH